jgi:hypothetical protein
MKVGDMVRFRPFRLRHVETCSCWKIGLLVEYQTWEKFATIIYDGELLRVRSSDVTKAGKKDGLEVISESR